jgi:hypothetical membrane protein
MKLQIAFISFGTVGSLIAIIATFISAFAYRGKLGERYSPLNHFISELGEVGVSRFAWVFNLGLIFTGLCLVPACFALGMFIPSYLSKIGMLSGFITAVGLSMVGFFPMNKHKPHAKAALTFFRGGLSLVLFFSLAIGIQPKNALVIPRSYWLAGLLPIISFGSFLSLMATSNSRSAENTLQPLEGDRPKIWIMPIVEWSIFLSIIFWFLLIAFGLGKNSML